MFAWCAFKCKDVGVCVIDTNIDTDIDTDAHTDIDIGIDPAFLK